MVDRNDSGGGHSDDGSLSEGGIRDLTIESNRGGKPLAWLLREIDKGSRTSGVSHRSGDGNGATDSDGRKGKGVSGDGSLGRRKGDYRDDKWFEL
ncbi:MAG TPA: hypothetical protein DIV86_04450 [Alphaproteobacteria bacterium]|nr:hypothetical protein [Alphaproteobacteria bacterium]